MLLVQINTRLLVSHAQERVMCKNDQMWPKSKDKGNMFSKNTKNMLNKPRKFPAKAVTIKPRKMAFLASKVCFFYPNKSQYHTQIYLNLKN